MEYQIRDFDVKRRKMKAWLSEWTSKIRPLGQRHGFKILGARVVPREKGFGWILGWDGKKVSRLQTINITVPKKENQA